MPSRDSDILSAYVPASNPVLPGGDARFLYRELKKIADTIATYQEVVGKLEDRIVALGG